MAESNKVLKSGLWYIISNIMIRAVGIITSPIYTSLLKPEEKVLADNFNAYVSIFTTVTCLCLIYSVGRAKLDFPDDFDGYVSAIQTLSSAFGIAVLVAAMVNVDRLSSLMQYQRIELFLMFAYLVIFPSIDYMQYKLRFEYKYKENIAISVIICITTVIASVALILLMPEQKSFAKILGTVVPSMTVGLWCYITLLRSGRVLYNKVYWIYALKIGLPMIPHGLALVILNKIDSLMIMSYCGKHDGGIYTTGYSIAVLLSVITNAIGQAYLPWFNEKLHAGERKVISEKTTLLMLAGCVMTLGFITVGPEAIKILTAASYHDCMYVLPPVAVGTLCQYFYTNYVNLELYHKKTAIIAVNSIAAAIANVILNYVFIQKYGYLAAAYTTVAGYFILMVLHCICTRVLLKEKLYKDVIYFAMLIVTGVLGCGLALLYDKITLRYGLMILLLGLVALWKKKDLAGVLEMAKSRLKKS
ncbi:MAG: oligosaccharide flippase family protein [Lachnospiraceae bacterium]|nr:oligosaccharide flippase family protein [Lachnospiraceae bacterium]